MKDVVDYKFGTLSTLIYLFIKRDDLGITENLNII